MFKNHEFRIRVVKPRKDEPNLEQVVEEETIDPEQIAMIAKELVTHTAITVVTLAFAYKAFSTICEIVVKKI